MGRVSVNVPGPGTYEVRCDPSLAPLDNVGTAPDVVAGKQFYNDEQQTVTGTMPNIGAVSVELEPGEEYDVPQGYHDGAGTVSARALTIDPVPTAGSGNLVASGGVYTALEGKQDTLKGTQGQVVGFDEDGNAVAQEGGPGKNSVCVEDGGSITVPFGLGKGPYTFEMTEDPDGSASAVASFNGRTGAVVPKAGDYTAAQVGARPDTWIPTAAEVGAVSSTSVITIQEITQAEYDALTTKNAATLYLVRE